MTELPNTDDSPERGATEPGDPGETAETAEPGSAASDASAGEARTERPPPRPEDERLYATLIHLSGLLWLFGVPGIVGVLIIWLLQRDRSAFVDAHGKEAMNFQISMMIYGLALAILAFAGSILSVILVGLVLLVPAVVLAVALIVFQVVVAILGAVEANRGGHFRYPLAIRFLS
ncbi:MAG: DUF4870 domain-containing protein [Thermoanaerobaculia bacterium]